MTMSAVGACYDEEDAHLLQLFRACDTRGTGFIGREDLREICAGIGIGPADSDALFSDLDRDQNGLIDFNDFAQGFGDFIGGQREATKASNPPRLIRFQQTQEPPLSPTNFSVQHVDDVEGLLQVMTNSPKLASCIKGVVKGLMSDMDRLRQENIRLEKVYRAEKEKHEKQLRQIEDEIDSQVLKMEENIRRKVKSEAEIEQEALKEKMSREIEELQTHLKLFQTFDSIMNSDREEEDRIRQMQQRLEQASTENRQLRMSLADTHTNIAVLNSELHRLRSQYADKCDELHSERESAYESLHHQQHLGKQLHLLQETNKRLQDVNDSIRSAMESNNNSSAKTIQRLNIKRGSIIGDYLKQEATNNNFKPITNNQRSKSTGHLLGNNIPEVDSVYESIMSPIQHSSDNLMPTNELNYPIKRFMEDIDSGLSKSCDAIDVAPPPFPAADQPQLLEEDVFEEVDLELGSVPPSPSANWAVLPSSHQSTGGSNRGRVYGIARTFSKSSLPATVSKRRQQQQQQILDQLRRDSTGHEQEYQLEPSGPPDRMYKVVFAGDAAVGKTSFILRISKGAFVPTSTSTLGVDFHVKTIRVDEKNVTLQLWDTAGQERFRSITKSYFRRADGVMLLYDCTSEHSFVNVRHWMEAIDEVAEKKIPIMLCANKIDLRESCVLQGKSIVRTEDGERLAREFSAIFIETSTKSGKHIADALVQLTREMASNEDWEVQTSGLRITQMELTSKKSSLCCGK